MLDVSSGGQVAVYWTRPVHASSLNALLSQVERERMATFRDDAARQSFATGRALLRVVAGAELGIDAARVRIDARCPRCSAQHGRPRLVDAGDLDVSVAHCAGLVVAAIARGARIGVDVEPRAAAGFDGFDDVALSARERARLAATPPSKRVPERTRMWVRKEAVLKLTGEGLFRSPETVDSDDPAVHFHEIDVGTGYYAVVAVPASAPAHVAVIDARPLLEGWAASLSSPSR